MARQSHAIAHDRKLDWKFQPMPVLLQTVLLLTASNIFMTFAWYGHLGSLKDKAWYIAVIVSWGIAFFELLQVPANRIGSTAYNVGELKIIQEVISLSVFVPIAVFYLNSRSNGTTCGRHYVLAARSFLFFATRGRQSARSASRDQISGCRRTVTCRVECSASVILGASLRSRLVSHCIAPGGPS